MLIFRLALLAPFVTGLPSGTGPGRYGLDIIYEPTDPVVDIIAVHGLNGNPESAWLAPNNVSWIRDLLPQHEKRSRIMTYGYNAGTSSNLEDISTQFMFNIAETLLSDITTFRQRDGTARRPIIFLAHSLGGLVVKSALIRSHLAQSEVARSLKLSTYGIFFFGTPHRGADGVAASRYLLNVKGIFQDTNHRILRHLQLDSEWLQEQSALYSHISGDFVTKFMYETQRTKILTGLKVLIVPYFSAVPGSASNSEPVALDADHVSMVKFAGPDSANFRRIVERLGIMISRCQAKIHENWSKSTYALLPTSSSGSIGSMAMSPASRLPLQLPYPRNERFVGRQEELSKLEEALRPSNCAHRLTTAVLYGIGGMGKTQIALELAYRYHKRYGAVFWVNARDELTAKTDFVSIARRLHPDWGRSGETTSTASNGLQDKMTSIPLFEEAQELVRTWLSDDQNSNWLMIFDNFDDIDSYDLRGKFFPQATHGSILVTSRRPASKRLGSFAIEIDELDPESAQAILRGMNTENFNSEHDDGDLQVLAKKLRFLPLALDQANAFIEAQQITYHEYLELYESDFARVAAMKPSSSFWSYESSLFTTWEVSMLAVTEHDEITGTCAVDLFIIMGFLSPDEIDPELFHHDSMQLLLQRKTPCSISESLGLLLSYSLIKRRDRGRLVSIHPVMQTWIRERLSHEKKIGSIYLVLSILHLGGWVGPSLVLEKRFQPRPFTYDDQQLLEGITGHQEFEDPRLFRIKRATLPHIDVAINALSQYLPRLSSDDMWLIEDLEDMKLALLGDNGLWEQSRRLIEERHLGFGSSAGSTVMPKDHTWLRLQGQRADAALLSGDLRTARSISYDMMEFVTKSSEYSHDSWPAIQSQALLTQIYITQGDIRSAESTLDALRNTSKAILTPPYDVSTFYLWITIRMHTAWISFRRGRIEEAEQQYSSLVQDMSAYLGPLNPNTLAALNDVAQIHQHQDQHRHAESILKQVIEKHVKIYGDHHPNTLVYKTNLARSYAKQGERDVAEKLLVDVCSAWQERLPNHPAALVSAIDLYKLTDGSREGGYFGNDPNDLASSAEIQDWDGRRRSWMSDATKSLSLFNPFSWMLITLSLVIVSNFVQQVYATVREILVSTVAVVVGSQVGILAEGGALSVLWNAGAASWSGVLPNSYSTNTTSFAALNPDICFPISEWRPYGLGTDEPAVSDGPELDLFDLIAFWGTLVAFYITGTGPFY